MKKVFGLFVMIMLSFSGLVFSGCDESYDDVSLTVSNTEIKVAVGETKSFNFEFVNYNSSMSNDVILNNVNELFKVVNYEATNNKVFYEIEGLRVGKTTIEAISYEGNKTCSLEVEVYENVKEFNLKTQPFVLKEIGRQYTLSQENYFEFLPQTAVKPDVTYKYTEDGSDAVITKIQIVENNLGRAEVVLVDAEGVVHTPSQATGEFYLTASLEEYPLINHVTFPIKIISPIDFEQIGIIKKGMDSNYLTTIEPVEENEEIVIVTSDISTAYYEFEVVTNTYDVKLHIESEVADYSILQIDPISYVPNGDNSLFFSLQGRVLGDGTIKLKLYYDDFSDYVVEKIYKVKVVTAPTSVNTNNIATYFEPIILYDNTTSEQGNYELKVNVLDKTAIFDTVDVKVVVQDEDQTLHDVANFSDYLYIYYKDGVKTAPFSMLYRDFVNNSSLYSIYIRGLSVKEKIFILLTVKSEVLTVEKTQLVPITIKEGVKSIDIMAEYAQGISLNISDGPMAFGGIMVSNSTSAYIGDFIFNYINDCSIIFEVQQVETNKTNVLIIPKMVGEGVVQIKLANGLSTTLKVIVEREIEGANFSVNSSNFISETETIADENQNLNIRRVFVQYTKMQTINDLIKLKFNLITNPIDATLYKVTASVDNVQIADFDAVYSILTVYKVGTVTLTYTVHPKYVENFKTIESTEVITFEVEIVIYSPIDRLDFVQNGEIVNQIKICKSSDVGYSYEALSKASFSIRAILLDGTEISDIFEYYSTSALKDYCSIEVSTPAAFTIVGNSIMSFGTISRQNSTYGIACTDPSIQTGTSFWFAITVKEYNTSKTPLLNIIVDNFKPLNSIGFLNYQESVYLSGANTSFTFFTQLDTESDCQEFEVRFVPSKAEYYGLFNIEVVNNTKVIVSHNSTKKQGSGTLYFIPKTAILNATGEFDMATVQTVFISYSDGSDPDNPELISTAQEFIDVMKDKTSISKHYIVLSTLDFAGKDVSGFQNLTGTITGSGEDARLINLNIDSLYNSGDYNFVALFPRIEATGKISNLAFEGSFSLIREEAYSTSNKNHFIGFIAGENYGEISNVSVNIIKSKVIINNVATTLSTSNIFIGGIVGANYGSILTEIDSSNRTYNHTLVTFKKAFEVTYQGVSENTAVGGVAGYNKGVIERTIKDSLVLFNENINSAYVHIIANGISQMGGISGINAKEDAASTFDRTKHTHSIIKNQCIAGILETKVLTVDIGGGRDMGGQKLGGVVGDNNSYIDSCTIRTSLTGHDYIAGIAGYDKTVNTYNASANLNNYLYIVNNKVQAKKQEIFAPMITSISSQGHVGAISGNEYKSLNTNVYGSELCGNIARYFYEANTAQFIYPILYNYQNGQFNSIPTEDKGCLFEYEQNAINILSIKENARIHKLETENSNYDNKIVNMFIYTAKDSKNQTFINHLNTNIEIPFVFDNFDALSFTSITENVLTINSKGMISLHATGLATIQVSSILDETFENFLIYIYVANAFDSYSIQVYNEKDLSSGEDILYVYENKPMELNYSFKHSSIKTTGSMGEQIEVELVLSPAPKLVHSYNTTDPTRLFTKITQNGTMIYISANTSTDLNQEIFKSNLVTFTPVYELEFAGIGKAYLSGSPENDVLASLLTCDKTLSVQIDLKQGTEKIELSYGSLSNIEPLDEIELTISQKTDLIGDYLTITSVKNTDAENGPKDYFKVIAYEGYVFENGVYNYQNTNGKFVIQFNYEKYGHLNYEGVYYVSFTADNGTASTLIITLNAQQLQDISLKNYYNVDLTKPHDPTKLQSSYLSSGTQNVLELSIYPFFADYDYIYITNNQENYAKNNIILMEVDYLDENNKFTFLKDVIYDAEGGAKITKETVEKFAVDSAVAKLYLTYTTISSATLDSFAKIDISAIKETNTEKIEIFSTEQIITIIAKDSVYFTIDNRTVADYYYVAKGLTYDLTLNIHGFTEQQMVYEIVNTNGVSASEARIVKNNGKYQLIISQNINYATGQEGYQLKIRSYGKNTVDGITYQSDISELMLYIVDFVVLTDNIGRFDATSGLASEFNKSTIIKDSNGAIIHVSVGNTYNLGVKFVNGISVEYDTNSVEVHAKVLQFEQNLTNNATWKIKTQQNGVLGDYTKQIPLNVTTNITESDYIKGYGSEDSAGNLNVSLTPLKIVGADQALYSFSFDIGFVYQNGVPVWSKDGTAYSLATDFVFNVFPSSNQDNAIPIDTYEDFVAMLSITEPAHYILMQDIVLLSDYQPKPLQIASFDGNGHKITLAPRMTFESGDAFGLFTNVYEGTLLKNVVIEVASPTVINIASSSAMKFGTLAGINNGIITNCQVVSKNNAQLSINLPNQAQDLVENYVAGFVGENDGFITNSHFSAVISAVANVSGFVGINTNKIASSYVRNASIINKSSLTEHKTAGFAIKNGLTESSNASITTSYVCGETNKNAIYSTSKTKLINAQVNASGFVFSNYNTISNCYSDIVINTSSISAGFIYENSGNVEYSYSTSSFNVSGTLSYIFVKDNSVGTSEVEGTYHECYYLGGEGTVNFMATQEPLNGVTRLLDNEFANANIFENFAVSATTNKIEAVWFYPSVSSEILFKDQNGSMSFTTGKLELVAPNILTSSRKVLDTVNTRFNESTGQTIYAYNETKESYGSYLNPILITSAEEFESYLIENSVNKVNSNNFRIVSDISYFDEQIYTTKTYNLTFAGIIEGNNMEIADFTIDNKSQTENGGLFAKIGQSNTNNGIVKNLILAPKYINLPNTQNAGTLAGTLDGGRLFNITCDGYAGNNDGVKIIGFNIVGGIVGYATNSFKIINVESSVSANSTYDHSKSNKQIMLYEKKSDASRVSYAGTILGVANGGGVIIDATAYDSCFIVGEVTGLLFGKIGANVTVKNINQTLNEEQFVIATVYGGILAGENSGTMQNITLTGTPMTNFFKKLDTKSNTSYAVGGVCGIMTNGTIENTIIAVPLVWAQTTPAIVGGLVGEMLGGTISGSTFTGESITAKVIGGTYDIGSLVVGGIVGAITHQVSIIVDNVLEAYDSVILNTVMQGDISITVNSLSNIYVGGIVGQVLTTYKIINNIFSTNLASHTLSGNLSQAKISVSATIYDGLCNVYSGGLVGAVFSDNTKLNAGEIIIFDEAHKDILENKIANKSESSFNINIQDKKLNALVNIYYGGIIGFGYSVCQPSVINEVPTTSKTYSSILAAYDKSQTLTNAEYLGQFNEHGEYIEDLTTTEYLDINVNVNANVFNSMKAHSLSNEENT